MPVLSADQLRTLSTEIFTGLGVPKTDAELVSTYLVDANLTGFDSHGVTTGTEADLVTSTRIRLGGTAICRYFGSGDGRGCIAVRHCPGENSIHGHKLEIQSGSTSRGDGR